MSETKKARGRPKKPETLERERIDLLLKNAPSYLKVKDDGFTNNIDFEQSKKIEKELIADFPPTVPHELIFAVNSHHEDPEDEQKIQDLINKALAAIESGRSKGTSQTKQNAITKAKKLWTKNADLIPRMQRVGYGDMTAKKIIIEWDTRGIGGNPPSINTIKNWFKMFIEN